MASRFRNLTISALSAGILIGAAFAAGAAFGSSDDPEASEQGLTSAQIQQLYGQPAGGAGASGPSGSGGIATGSGSGLGGTTLGRVTAIEGQTVTVQTAQGSVKLNLSVSTTVSKVEGGARNDLAVGDVVAATGTRKDDGSVDTTSVSEVPTELQNLAGSPSTPAAR